jgi:hypothetical protein
MNDTPTQNFLSLLLTKVKRGNCKAKADVNEKEKIVMMIYFFIRTK